MQGFLTLILILAPMFVGFALPNRPSLTAFAEKGLTWLVFVILCVIGVELGQVENLHHQLTDILKYLVVLMILTLGFGTIALFTFEKFRPTAHQHSNQPKTTVHLHGSLIQILCLAAGFCLAKTNLWTPPEHTITALLMILLFLVGISLKGANISLYEVLLNRQGIAISGVFILSTLMGGAVFSLLFTDVSLTQGLALASGFGWYSLSGTIITDAYGAVWGSVALFNDLGREILALLFIPHLMRHSPASAIGLGGVTSLDFTLPTLTQSGGVQIVPLVISFGFITNVISPILMVGFSRL